MPVTDGFPTTPRVALPQAPAAGSSRSLALRALGVLIASAAIAVAVATLTSGAGPASPPAAAPPQPVHAAVPEVSAVPQVQAAAFAILRRPRTAADAFAEIHPGAGPFGANPMLARTALAPARPGGVVPRLVSVVPAAGNVCLRILEAVRVAQWWCTPTARARRGALIVALLPPAPTPAAASTQFVIGLVPDGVRSVTVDGLGGGGHKLAVRRNVYATALYGPQKITFKIPGRGTESYRIRD